MRVRHFAALLWIANFSLMSCGGGGDSSAPVGPPPTTPPAPPPAANAPVAPTVTLTYGIKQLKFSWTPVSGATHYRFLERAEATGDFAQIGADLTATNVNHDIALHRRLNAAYRVEACNSNGCATINPISPAANLLPAIGYFKASNTGANDRFGAVALSADGNTLAVGAFGEGSNASIGGNQGDDSAPSAGAVYVFVRNAGVWSQQAFVKASNSGADDFFGYAVALSADGSTLAVGAHGEDSNATGIGGNEVNNSALDAGAVYVFTRNAGTWSQQAYVKASNTDAGDRFGFAVALSADGSRLAVGAQLEDSSATIIGFNPGDNSASAAGAAYVFARNAGNWSQQAYIKPSNTGANDFFGSAVALSADGDTLAVGAYNEDSNAAGVGGIQSDNSAPDAGAVYVFARISNTWLQQAYVKASNTEAGDSFGVQVALSADGNTLAVGAYAEAGNAGAVYVFARNAGIWSHQAYIKASNTQTGDFFGTAVALSADGNTLAIGATGEDSSVTGIGGNQNDSTVFNAGAVYVFTRSAGNWSQQSYVKSSNTQASDSFGSRVALSADGNTLAVGAILEDSLATGIGNDQSNNLMSAAGAVYLF